MKKALLCLIIAVLLNACGYHLKQPIELDPALKKTYLDLSLTSPLYQHLATALTNQGIELVEADSAEARLVIGTNNIQKEIQSIGVNNRVQEYRLNYRLSYQLTIDDEVVMNSGLLELMKDYSFDIGQIAGTQSEEQLLRKQLYQDMAEMIIRNLANQKLTQ